jgi:hypothetical protein
MFVYADGRTEITVRLSERKVLLHDGQCGLRYFPDGAMAVLAKAPGLRILLSAGVSSYLLEGASVESLTLVKQVLSPGGKGSCDNGYAGISGAYRDPKTGELFAFYHAEDQEGMGRLVNGVPGFYCSIALAVSKDDGLSFAKLGPVITSHLPKDPNGTPDQGCGEVSVLPDASAAHLYAYYTDHSRVDGRGVQICMARSPIGDGGLRPGAWTKFCEGSFSQPGLGGKDAPVVSGRDMQADAIFPHVTYCKALRKYVMVFNVNAYRELVKGRSAEKSGIYVTFSDDGILWSKPVRLIADYSICRLDESVAWHPTLLWSEDGRASGWLLYSYSERWGHEPPQKAHYLVGQPITFLERRLAP